MDTMNLLDPWNDAAVIAARLATPNARLVVFIGAESWCERCRSLKPAFEATGRQRDNQNETWIWLDLEEHADLLNGFIPEDLPILMRYRGTNLAEVLSGRAVTSTAFTEDIAGQPGDAMDGLPDIRKSLMAADWAS